MSVKFPDVSVKLTGKDGNAFFIVGKVRQALIRAGHRTEAMEFMNEATSGDYNHVLATCMKWVNVE